VTLDNNDESDIERGLGNSRIFDELPIDVISFKDFSHVYTSNLGEMQWVETC